MLTLSAVFSCMMAMGNIQTQVCEFHDRYRRESKTHVYFDKNVLAIYLWNGAFGDLEHRVVWVLARLGNDALAIGHSFDEMIYYVLVA